MFLLALFCTSSFTISNDRYYSLINLLVSPKQSGFWTATCSGVFPFLSCRSNSASIFISRFRIGMHRTETAWWTVVLPLSSFKFKTSIGSLILSSSDKNWLFLSLLRTPTLKISTNSFPKCQNACNLELIFCDFLPEKFLRCPALLQPLEHFPHFHLYLSELRQSFPLA